MGVSTLTSRAYPPLWKPEALAVPLGVSVAVLGRPEHADLAPAGARARQSVATIACAAAAAATAAAATAAVWSEPVHGRCIA